MDFSKFWIKHAGWWIWYIFKMWCNWKIIDISSKCDVIEKIFSKYMQFHIYGSMRGAMFSLKLYIHDMESECFSSKSIPRRMSVLYYKSRHTMLSFSVFFTSNHDITFNILSLRLSLVLSFCRKMYYLMWCMMYLGVISVLW